MVDLEEERLRSLVTYALILGVSGGTFLYLTAPMWASLWGVESATEPIRWLAIGSAISPFLGLSTGLMARTGKFRALALITVTSNIIGMAAGAAAVIVWESASALVVSNALAQLLIVVGSLLSTDRQLLGMSRLRRGNEDIGYSGKLMLANILSYLTGNITKVSMTRGIDASSLGFWNRAEVLSSIPFQQVQSALIRAAYPEFRHDIADSTRARAVWTDMLVLVAWIALTLCAGVYVFVPPLVPIIFGEGWNVAATLVGPLAVVGALQIVTTLLASAIEALGKFRWIWSTDVILIGLQVAAAVLIFVYRDIYIAVAALVLTNLVRHGWQVWLAGRSGYLNVPRLLAQYAYAAAFAGGLGAAAWLALWCFRVADAQPGSWMVGLAISVSTCAVIAVCRERFPAVVLARKYGFLNRSR